MVFIVVATTQEGKFGKTFKNSTDMKMWLAKMRLLYGLLKYTVWEFWS